MHQNAQICMLQFKIFPGAMPRTPYWGKPHPLGTPALRASPPRSASIVPQRLLAADATGHSFRQF